jgi:hypothetical protein
MDEDADKDGKTEGGDSKEDECNEENFLNQNNLLLPIKFLSEFNMSFDEKAFSLSQPSLEISSPPPQV